MTAHGSDIIVRMFRIAIASRVTTWTLKVVRLAERTDVSTRAQSLLSMQRLLYSAQARGRIFALIHAVIGRIAQTVPLGRRLLRQKATSRQRVFTSLVLFDHLTKRSRVVARRLLRALSEHREQPRPTLDLESHRG